MPWVPVYGTFVYFMTYHSPLFFRPGQCLDNNLVPLLIRIGTTFMSNWFCDE
ncbi:MAG: hypothetical protein Q9210_004774 [Variospora velana]